MTMRRKKAIRVVESDWETYREYVVEYRHHDSDFVVYIPGRKRSKREQRNRRKGTLAKYLRQ